MDWDASKTHLAGPFYEPVQPRTIIDGMDELCRIADRDGYSWMSGLHLETAQALTVDRLLETFFEMFPYLNIDDLLGAKDQ